MGFFGRKKDKEKEKEKKGGLFGWMKRKQADEPEREEQIVEPEPETDTDDVAAQMLAEREAARQAETLQPTRRKQQLLLQRQHRMSC